ncbi:MAG TPA: hypothetical protein VHZ54_08730 [Solirubrobacterales bacterium]|nr:hypothetical protein [Solirubrobacterales bacterium]
MRTDGTDTAERRVVNHRRSHVRKVARRLDLAGVDAIGVGHGDGIGGSSLQAAAEVVENATIAVSLIAGVGVKEHLQVAWDCGARRARIATHATEADISMQHTGAVPSSFQGHIETAARRRPAISRSTLGCSSRSSAAAGRSPARRISFSWSPRSRIDS